MVGWAVALSPVCAMSAALVGAGVLAVGRNREDAALVARGRHWILGGLGFGLLVFLVAWKVAETFLGMLVVAVGLAAAVGTSIARNRFLDGRRMVDLACMALGVLVVAAMGTYVTVGQ